MIKRAMIHLVGGGPGAIAQTRRHFHSAIAALHKKAPLVAYVGAASKDNVGFRKMLTLALGNARVEPVRLASPKAKVSEARQLLDDCDLVFVSGGDVDLGMQILGERGVVEDFHRLAKAEKPFLGVSAGSIMLAQHWVRFPDDDEAKAELFSCLGIAPVHVDCHSEDDGWSELRVLMRLLPEGSIGYGIPSKGCLQIDAQLSSAGVPLPRFRTRRGKAVEDGEL
jgi:peptidase E